MRVLRLVLVCAINVSIFSGWKVGAGDFLDSM